MQEQWNGASRSTDGIQFLLLHCPVWPKHTVSGETHVKNKSFYRPEQESHAVARDSARWISGERSARDADGGPRQSGCLRQHGEQINHSRTSCQGWTQMRLCVHDNQMATWMLSLFAARASADIWSLRQCTQAHLVIFIREYLLQCSWSIA